MKSLFLCLFMLFIIFSSGFTDEIEAEEETDIEIIEDLDIEEIRRRIRGEAPNEIMAISLGDSEVSLFLTGFWKGELQLNPGYFYTPYASGIAQSDTPFFMQEADLTLALWINDKWFVEANFLDGSSQNTYRAGYQGFPGEIVQYAGIGNTGLDFPSFPYIDLGGDSPSSFGFYGRFGNDSLNVHTLFRYDSSSRDERTFYGNRERNYSYVQPQNTVRGVSFVLPDTDIDAHIIIYIEDDKGTIRDSSGRRWRILPAAEYAVSRTQGRVELSIRPVRMAAISYFKNGERPWNNSMGSYDGSQEGYLKDVQQWFNSGPESYNLAAFPQSGNRNTEIPRPGEVFFSEGAALVIYEPGTFSPFENRNRYDAPSSNTDDALLVLLSTEMAVSGFELIPYDAITSSETIPFLTAISRRVVYELLKTGNFSKRDPEYLWPLADSFPEIYLPGNVFFPADITLRFTNFNNTSGYFIGTDVVPGSVQVWRSGIQDANFSYNSSTGEVIISGSVGQNELIRITFLKRSEETRFGSIAAGVGAIYNNSGPFSAQAAIGIRMNLSDDATTGDDYTSAGTIGISAKTSWDYDNLKAHITAGFAVQQTDTTGIYRAAGMEGNEMILPLPADSSFLSNPFSSSISSGFNIYNRSDLIYRNYYNNNILGSNLMSIDWNTPVISGVNRPYPVKDPQLGDSHVLAAEFILNENEWTGFQVPLNRISEFLSNAEEIEIPYRFYDFNQTPSNIKLIIQIGSLSGKDFVFTENPSLIWERVLFSDDIISENNNFYSSTDFNHSARIARFRLNDQDRLKLGDAKYLRLVMVNEGNNEISGRVLLAGPITRGTAWRSVTYDGIDVRNTDKVTAIETIDTGVTLRESFPQIIRRLHTSGDAQRVLQIDWENMDAGESAGVDAQLSKLPLSDYCELTFFVKKENNNISSNNETISIIISGTQSSISQNYLEAQIPLNVFNAKEWSKVTIRYQGNSTGVFVNDKKISNANFNFTPQRFSYDSSQKMSYVAVFINPSDPFNSLNDGTIYIDEIILEDSVVIYRMNAGASFNYSKPGDMFSIGGISVLSDFSVTSAIESEARLGTELEDSGISGSVVSRSGLGVSLFGFNVHGNVAFTAAEDTFLWSGDHSVSRTIGYFSVRESFFASPDDNTARHSLNLSFLSNFNARYDSDVLYDFSKLRKDWKLEIGYRPKKNIYPSISVKTQAIFTESLINETNDNYASIWYNSWKDMIPDIGLNANTRRTNAQILLTQRTTPVGAVITIDGNMFFSAINNSTRLENSFFLDIPISINKVSINLRSGRIFRQNLDYSGESVIDDGSKFLDSVNDSFAFWKTIPVYSIFDPSINSVMDKMQNDTLFSPFIQYTSYNEQFAARINLPTMYNLNSFFIPNRYIIRFDRIIEQKMDTRADVLNFNCGIGFSSINMFGVMGYKPLFSFLQSDEYSHVIDALFSIPNDYETQWRVQSLLNTNFRLVNQGSVFFRNQLTLRYNDQWVESFTAGWEEPTKRSLTSLLYNWITSGISAQSGWLTISSLLSSDYEQFRRESLEIMFDNSGEFLRWSVTAGHEEIVRILGRLNFSTFVKLKFGGDLYRELFTIEALIGTSFRISF